MELLHINRYYMIAHTKRQTCAFHLIVEGEEGVKFLHCKPGALCVWESEQWKLLETAGYF